MKGKQKLLAAAVSVAAICLLPALASARVTGQCANCHTMHNSQDSASMQKNSTVGTYGSGPQESLTRGNCVGCHSGDTAIVDKAPSVMSLTNPPTYQLAGGSFWWVAQDGGAFDAKGHNTLMLNPTSSDAKHGLVPPGWTTDFGTGVTTLPTGASGTWGTQLGCAGTFGCHGQHKSTVEGDFTAISGGHHGNDSTIDGSTIPKSYRFLFGVTGIEDTDWELTVSSSDHNIYKGRARTTDTSTHTDADTTISFLCAKCHGKFHSGTGTEGTDTDSTFGAAWLRHPTDLSFADVLNTEYATYNDSGDYSTYAPVASTDPATVLASDGFAAVSMARDGSTEANTGIVMCLSCHRAHGTPYNDLMRWDYSANCQASTATFDNTNCGCFVCHTTKDDQ